MDINKYLQPEFDFSQLDSVEFENSPDVTPVELMSAFRNGRTRAYNDLQYPIEYNRWYCLGFSHRSRCFELIMTINDYGKYVFLSFNLLNEYEIGLFWCQNP